MLLRAEDSGNDNFILLLLILDIFRMKTYSEMRKQKPTDD